MRIRDRGERGTAGLEVVAAVPFLLLVGAIAFQFGLVGWTAVSTTEAARAAARAAARGENPVVAVEAALPAGLTASSVTGARVGDGYSYTVRVPVPAVVPLLDLGEVSRSADMPALS